MTVHCSPLIKNISIISVFLIVPGFSSHPAYLSTRLVVFSVYLWDWAETTAACLITFPLTAWSHSRPVVFHCMASECYSTCCTCISFSLSSWLKSPVITTLRSVLHQSCRLWCFYTLTFRWFSGQVFLKAWVKLWAVLVFFESAGPSNVTPYLGAPFPDILQ